MTNERSPRDGSQTVIFNEDKSKVLLILREDFRIWVPPGGNADAGESFEACAAREAFEETGYKVTIDYFLGEYHRPQRGHVTHVFVGHVTGGDGSNHSWESLAVEWHNVDALPKRMIGLSREIIDDACTVTDPPVQRTQMMPRWQLFLINSGMKIRDVRNRILRR